MNISQHCFMPSTQLLSGYYNDSGVFSRTSANYNGDVIVNCFVRTSMSLCYNRVRIFDKSNKLQLSYSQPFGKITYNLIATHIYVVHNSNVLADENRVDWAKHYPSVVFF